MCGTARLGSLLALVAMISLPSVVEAQFTYTTNNGSITITGYTGPGGAVTISNTINGLPVTSIGGGAFSNCGSLASVAIASSITNIGRNAFFRCTNLTSVTIPNSVTSIGSNAFFLCSRMASVTIPSGVTSIGAWTFYHCDNLTNVTILNGVPYIGYAGPSAPRTSQP